MSKEGQDEWVFDSLVGLLRGPVWNVPILTFIEHKSLSEWTSATLYQLDGSVTQKGVFSHDFVHRLAHVL